jgi:hypothetical protein
MTLLDFTFISKERLLHVMNRLSTGNDQVVAGRLVELCSVSCTIDDAKRIGLEVVDRLMPETPHWQAAENKHGRDSFLRRCDERGLLTAR